MHNKVKVLFELFYQRAYGKRNYVFHLSESAEKQIDNFIKLLDKRYTLESIGDQFLVTYFIFQFGYWSELDITSYNKEVSLSYIIGNKAFNRYLDRDIEFDYTIDLYEVKKTNLTKGEALDALKEKSEVRHDTLKHEEVEKSRFANTDRQLINCLENTTLYNPRSKHCLSCHEKTTCKEMLKSRFPQIYFHRFKRK